MKEGYSVLPSPELMLATLQERNFEVQALRRELEATRRLLAAAVIQAGGKIILDGPLAITETRDGEVIPSDLPVVATRIHAGRVALVIGGNQA